MTSVLVTTDGSQPSRRVLPHAARFAAACGARVVILRVLNPAVDLASELALSTEAATERVAAAWQAELEGVLAAAGTQGTALVAVRASGEDTQDTILRVADEEDAAIIAMHSRGTGALRHALLGNVALGVLGGSGRPLMLTGEHAEAPPANAPYRLVMTTDGSPASLDVVHALAPFLSPPQFTVTLVRICEPRSGRPGPEAEQEACRHQVESVHELLPPGLAGDCKCPAATHDQPISEAIIEAANGADAIAMSTHGHTALRHLLAGSVALEVLAASPMPVILARSR